MNEIFGFFTILILLSVFMTITSINPIHSIFWLVLTFLLSSTLLILLRLDFLPLIMIIIYVGAIAILFLFVIMMLDVVEINNISNNNISIILILLTIFTVSQIILFCKFKMDNTKFLENWTFENLDQIQLIGSLIYTNLFFILILISILLLIAMVGVIILTLESTLSKHQDLINQHYRNNSWT